jgi:hypothetical protein
LRPIFFCDRYQHPKFKKRGKCRKKEHSAFFSGISNTLFLNLPGALPDGAPVCALGLTSLRAGQFRWGPVAWGAPGKYQCAHWYFLKTKRRPCDKGNAG